MNRQAQAADGHDRLERLMADIQMPLENIEFTIEQYLLDNGTRLDPETRFLLARVRDSVGRVAVSTRRIASVEAHEPPAQPRLAYPAA